MKDTCGAFKCSDGMWSFSYNNVNVWQLVQILMSSNKILKREAHILTEGRRRRLISKLKVLAKDFDPVLEITMENKSYNVGSVLEINSECSWEA